MKPWLIFDFDGTVANSIDKLRQLINDLAPRYGFSAITAEKFSAMRDLPLTRAVRVLRLPLYKLSGAIALVLNEYRRIIPDLEPCPGVIPMLRELKAAGCALALISSNRTDNLQAWLRHHCIDCFDWVEGTNGILKKHVNIRGQIRRHALDSEAVIYVGDEVRDIKAARKSRVRVISVTWGLHSAGHLSGSAPDWLVRDPREIVSIAQGLLINTRSETTGAKL